jgi:hypothetical protein
MEAFLRNVVEILYYTASHLLIVTSVRISYPSASSAEQASVAVTL